jgi:hypothetical protein
MAIKIVRQNKRKGILEVTMRLPDGQRMLISIHEHSEDGIFIGAVDRDSGKLPGIWVDTLYMDKEMVDEGFSKLEQTPRVHIYATKDVDANGKELEGTPVSLLLKDHTVEVYADDGRRLRVNTK